MKKLLLAALFSMSALAHAGDVDVQSPWVRGTVDGQKASGAFMTLTSARGAALVGVAVSKTVAEDAQVHEMKMDGDRMSMGPVARVELPAGKPVTLASGGYHIMLTGLKQTLKPGSNVLLELKIETPAKRIETIKVNAPVRDLASSMKGTSGMNMGNDHHM
ncbi:MAG TPA: copper chaperone PCu(A)C [Rhodocyclaceae bacterium]|jgi:copper(I)-binding protein|nr:copper chaperone PCu(A)C [Rhodocyclaceae bacterium]